jgi:hypothetical protein
MSSYNSFNFVVSSQQTFAPACSIIFGIALECLQRVLKFSVYSLFQAFSKKHTSPVFCKRCISIFVFHFNIYDLVHIYFGFISGIFVETLRPRLMQKVFMFQLFQMSFDNF